MSFVPRKFKSFEFRKDDIVYKKKLKKLNNDNLVIII